MQLRALYNPSVQKSTGRPRTLASIHSNVYFSGMALHMIKLVVGLDDLASYAKWQAQDLYDFEGGKANVMHTRNWPRQQNELLDGGSAYRVIKGRIVCRQRIIGFQEGRDAEYGAHCMIMLDPEIIQTVALSHRPFQGWRYLQQKDAPADRGIYNPANDDPVPAEMEAALRELGLI